MIKDNLLEVLHEMEEVTKLFKLEPFDIYLIGGGACILGEYTTRATLDIDFVDLGYPAKYGKVFVLLRDYDMLEYQSTILSPNYKERATKLEEFKYINVYILSKEDVAVSKIIRFQNAVQLIDSDPNMNLTQISNINGYYDQSHFIKELVNIWACHPKNTRKQSLNKIIPAE